MRRLITLILLLAAAALAACGGDDGDGNAASAAGSQESGAYPVTIRSKFGSATISEAPQRVVTLDNQATDDALTLGVTPVGIAKISFVEGGVQEWTKAELRGKTPPLLDVDTALPYERSPRCAPTSSWRLTPTCWTARPTTD